MVKSSLLRGSLMHARTTPVVNRFVYPILYLLVDLDELDELDRRLPLFGVNRAAPITLHNRDHLGDYNQSLKANLLAHLRSRGVEVPAGRILLLTMPRIFGYVFNPVSFFYCYDADGELAVIVAEVNNTVGGRHPYILVRGQESDIRADGSLVYLANKVFYVSPFIEMDVEYEFVFSQVGEKLSIQISDYQDGEKFFTTKLWGEQTPLTDAALRKVLVTYPLMTMIVMFRILWQAFKLLLRRVPVVGEPEEARKSV